MNDGKLKIAQGMADMYVKLDDIKKEKFKKEPTKTEPKRLVGWEKHGDTKLDNFLKFQNKVEQGW